MEGSFWVLTGAAATIGLVHTAAGPDHYLPFIAMARAGRWSLARTLALTTLCGIGHVVGSIALGLAGIALGWAITGIEVFEALRGDIATWLLLGFGIAYTAWGIRHALRKQRHTHLHAHADGTVHEHPHVHVGEHAHAHAPPFAPRGPTEQPGTNRVSRPGAWPSAMTPWILFTIFVFGPCEPLVPLLMYPAAEMNLISVAAVAGVFSLVTIGTMLAIVTVAVAGFSTFRLPRLERYSHLTAGLALTACAAAMMVGF